MSILGGTFKTNILKLLKQPDSCTVFIFKINLLMDDSLKVQKRP